ncbi:beta-lactamase-like protein [Podospora aff. communis PSN243]|uniref:Beta-lactamase-like protein n=1 Tax=Podospora aff. communis PSN243 TaxID=3040156 RepID=A0AAV9GE15_9PEZI|nr:beta-lactamase-like protein [Podospora aff. communis PSN243]
MTDANLEPIVNPIFEPETCTWQYIVADPATKDAVIIDSVLDYNPATNTISNTNAEKLLTFISEHNYTIVAILETHAHADHLTAARYLQQTLFRRGHPLAPICIGALITSVQQTFAAKYRIPAHEYANVFDRLLKDGSTLPIGNLTCRVLHLPGHTPDHIGYLIGSNVFVGDSLFQPDVGSARCDFPGGSAHALFRSITTKLYTLPDDYRVYVGHDYPPGGPQGRTEPRAFATVAEQRGSNKHVRDGVEEGQFIAWREERDASLAEPRLIHQSLQFNIRGGRLPEASKHGHRFLHVPLRVADEVWSWGFAPQG